MPVQKIQIPVNYNATGAPAKTKVPHSSTDQFELVWNANGNGVTFGDSGSNQAFWWKSGSGQPSVTVSSDGTKLTSAAYSNSGPGSTWTYGLTLLKDGANPIVIDPVIENEPPGNW